MKKTLTAFAFALLVHGAYAQKINESRSFTGELRSLALKKVPKSYHDHPEFGKYSLDMETPNVELIHLRTANAKTFLDVKGRYHTQQTGGVSNFRNSDGLWISMQENISIRDHQAGIFRTELPMHVDLAGGETFLSLDRSGNAIQYGQSSLHVLSKDMGRISSIDKAYAGTYETQGNEVTLKDYFQQIDRIQDFTYWSLQTDFLIRNRMDFGSDAAYIEFEDRIQLPSGWTLAYAEGEMAGAGFQGMLQVLNEKGGVMSEISKPELYDSFRAAKKEDRDGHGAMGYYVIEEDQGAYLLKLRVPLAWLNSEKLVYPVRIDPTVSNTYASGQALQDKNTTFSPGCQSTMTVSIPISYYQVTGTNISYTIKAKGYIASQGSTDYYGDREEQRSRIGAGSNWTATQSGTGINHSGPANDQAYSLTNQTIANGCYNSIFTITYTWQGYQTFFPVSGGPASTTVAGCVTNYQELVANTWVVTTTYQPVTLAVSTSNVSMCVTKSVALGATVTGATSVSWSPATNLSSATVTNPVASPAATTVYTLTAADGFCTQTGTVTVTVNAPASTGLSTGDWVFTGSVSSEYENPSNWLKWTGAGYTAILTYTGQTAVRPPQITDNVRIKPNGTCVSTQPVIMNAADGGFTAPNSISANSKNIVIESGATLGFSSNASHFHVAETWTNDGTLTPSNGRVKFIGTGAQSVNGSGPQTFYEMNIGGNSITTLNVGTTVTYGLRLNGIVVTGSNLFHLTNTAADATSLPINTGHIFGTFRRSIAANTNVYAFPVGVGTTLNTHRRLLEYVNNNVAGVSYLDCSVSNTFKGSGSNTDAFLDPLKAKHNLQLFTTVSSEAEWMLTPNAAPSGGNYGVRLYVQNFAGLTDNRFAVLKRPDGSNTFFDYSAFYTTTTIPAQNAAGRIYNSGAGYAQKSGFTSFSKFAIASSPTPLPVELTDLGAMCYGEATGILWATASEHNSQKFVVERSRDLSSWEYVTEKLAAGNSNHTIHYQAEDAHPMSGISYYRLLQTDIDGSTAVYGPVSISCHEVRDGISVFPNPSNGSFTVEISNEGKQLETEIQLIDVAGKIVERRMVKVSGVSQVLFNDADFQAGTYIVRLLNNAYKPVKVVIR